MNSTWTRRGGRWSKNAILSTFKVKNVHLEVGGCQRKAKLYSQLVIECLLIPSFDNFPNLFAISWITETKLNCMILKSKMKSGITFYCNER